MTDTEIMDEHIKPIARRLNAIAHILQTSQPEDSIRDCLCTLVEDNHESFQRLLEVFAVVESPPEPTGQSTPDPGL